jgi:small subunit ribosomal protein S6
VTRRYETVYIFDSALEEPAVSEKLTRFHALLTKDGKGSVSEVAHWGKRTLTYRIKKKDTGYYVVAKFEAEGAVLPEYERVVKLDEGVLRYLVVQAGPEPAKPPVAPAAALDDDAEEEDA